MDEPPVCVPAPGDVPRPIGLIASEEIQQAAIVVLRQPFGMTKDDLIREAARLFGHNRTGTAVKSRIETAVAQLVQEGVVLLEGNRVRIANRLGHRQGV